MTYTVTPNATVYLRVANDTVYNKGSWSPEDSTNDPDPTSNWSSFTFPRGLLPRDNTQVDGGIGEDQQTVSATLDLQANATGDEALVPFTGDPESVDLPGSAQGVVADPGAGALLTVDEVKLEQDIVNGMVLVTTAYVSTATQAQLEAAGTDYPTWTNQFTDLPDDASHGAETIHTLAEQWTAGIDRPVRRGDRHREPPPQPGVLHVHPQPAPGPHPGDVAGGLLPDHEPQGLLPVLRLCNGIDAPEPRSIPTRLVSGFGPGITRAQSGRKGEREQTGQHRRRAQLGRGVLPRIRLDSVRADAGVEPGRLPALPTRPERGHRRGDPDPPSTSAGATNGQGDHPESRQHQRRPDVEVRRDPPGAGDRSRLRCSVRHRRPLRSGAAVVRCSTRSLDRRLAACRDTRGDLGGGSTKSRDPQGVCGASREGSTPRLTPRFGELAERHRSRRVQRVGCLGARTRAGAAHLAPCAVRRYPAAEEISRLSRSCATSAPAR